jgi:outer membrane protein
VVAVDLSLGPDESILLPALETSVMPNADFARTIHELLDEAKQNHPKVLMAAAQWQASLENIKFTRAQGLPVVKLVGESDRSNEPVSASLGQPELPALSRDNYIGLRIEIPLFEGFRRGYELREAEAQADVKEQSLRDTQQQIAISVWTSVQTLEAGTENLRNTEAVLQSAKQAVDAAERRYRSGVGSILEVLGAESTLAMSEEQRIHAQLEWRNARVQLAASLGNLVCSPSSRTCPN